MKTIIDVTLVILCILSMFWVITLLVKCFFNLAVYIKALIHPTSVPRTSGSIAYNKKSNKLEETPGNVLLPFPEVLSVKNIVITFLIIILFLYVR